MMMFELVQNNFTFPVHNLATGKRKGTGGKGINFIESDRKVVKLLSFLH